jgi:hypothetical protein
MTTFHFEAARVMIEDLLADQDPWWDGELDTLTGCSRVDYRELQARLDGGFRTKTDRHMLNNAANTLLHHPGISTSHCRNALGEDWREIVGDFLERKPPSSP